MPKNGLGFATRSDTKDLWLPRRDILQQVYDSTILARWRAEDLLVNHADGDAITEWVDYSGNGNNLVPITAAPLLQTDAGPNGYPRVEFEASSTQDLGMSAAPLCTALSGSDIPFTFIWVFNLETVAADSYLGLGHSTGQGYRVCGGNAAGTYRWLNRDDAATAVNANLTGTSRSTGVWYVSTYVFDGTAVSQFQSQASGGTVASNVGTATFNRLRLGSSHLVGAEERWMDGDLTEAIVLSGALGSADRKFIESFYGKKYALTLPA